MRKRGPSPPLLAYGFWPGAMVHDSLTPELLAYGFGPTDFGLGRWSMTPELLNSRPTDFSLRILAAAAAAAAAAIAVAVAVWITVVHGVLKESHE